MWGVIFNMGVELFNDSLQTCSYNFTLHILETSDQISNTSFGKKHILSIESSFISMKNLLSETLFASSNDKHINRTNHLVLDQDKISDI